MIEQVQIGEIVRTDQGESYIFVEYQDVVLDELIPFYYQVDLTSYKVVDVYPRGLFASLTEGSNLEVGGKIIAIEKSY